MCFCEFRQSRKKDVRAIFLQKFRREKEQRKIPEIYNITLVVFFIRGQGQGLGSSKFSPIKNFNEL
jgi:hypothetical protein